MKKITDKIMSLYRRLFMSSDADLAEGSYPDWLNYEAGKIFYIVLFGMFALLFYIPRDLELHTYPQLAVAFRIGMCVLSIIAVIINIAKRGKNVSVRLLMAIMVYHCVMTAVLAGTAGVFAAPYISGYAFVLMLYIIAPFTIKFKAITALATLALFLSLALWFDLDFSQGDVRYSTNDLVTAFGICIMISASVSAIRYDSWMQRKELSKMLEQREEDLKKINNLAEDAKAASHAKSAFLASMSHEIRTPINAVIGMTELALREEEPDVAKEHVFTARQAAFNLLAIINDVLDFSKIEAGKLEIIPKQYSTAKLLGDIISVIRMRVSDSERDIKFAVKIDSRIPHIMFGDETRIRQVAINILSNAVKYTDEGHILFTVYGQIVGDDTINITFEVSDTGIGIKQEDLKKLYSEFTQFDLDRNRGVEGIGLGLAITHSIIEAMGGDISVSSEYQKGSVFTVTIPQKFKSKIALAYVKKPKEKHVLIFESFEICMESLAWTLANLGVECTSVKNSDDLYEKMKSRSYDHLFIAYDLYTNNAEAIDEFCKDTSVTVITGFGETVSGKNISTVSLPVLCTSIADILNGKQGEFSFKESGGADVEFTAPQARVLVADDIRTNLKVTRGLLAPYNMQVDMCTNGEDAISAVGNAYTSVNPKTGRVQPYDLIFMDHKMPVMDGVRATEHIRKMGSEPDGDSLYYKSVPIIALTAHALAGMKEMYISAGFDDYIPKPIDAAKLNAIVDKWLPDEKKVNTEK